MVSTCRKRVKGEVGEAKVKAKAFPEGVGLERDEFIAKGSREGSSRREGVRTGGRTGVSRGLEMAGKFWTC